MLTSRENFLATLSGDGPEYLVNQYEPFVPIMCDPLSRYTRGNRVRGSVSKDRWGTTIAFPVDQHAAMPHVTDDNKVLPDITEWRKYVKVPDIVANCTDGWEDAIKQASEVDRKEKLVMGFMGTGIFEQLHFLMGFEDTLCNFLTEPEAMDELIQVVFEYRFTYAKMIIENLKPDIILSHDDWGEKRRLFMSPEIWRKFLKPRYAEFYGYMRDHGVITMHHADSNLTGIVSDMAEIGIQVWQGVLPQNDIPAMKKELNGKMTLMGGIDAAVVDSANTTEETIRNEVRRCCDAYAPGGFFIPSQTYGLSGSIFPHVDPIITDEISKLSPKYFK
ncbi:MAG: uroporphyrinogen decarboxylase family protein [Oscillospiraceae bacterium]